MGHKAGNTVVITANLEKTKPIVEYWDNEEPSIALNVEMLRVIYNDPATILFYKDRLGNEKKVVAIAKPGDKYSKAKGFDICLHRLFIKYIKIKLASY